MAEVHAEIKPFKALVHEKFLYDMDESKTGLIKCVVIAVSSYPGHALTFTIHIPETGGIFCYIPIHSLRSRRMHDAKLYDTAQLQVVNCIDEHISVTTLDYLVGKPVVCFLRNPKVKVIGKYLFSVDWYKQNELVNVIELENGQYCALPLYRSLYGVDANAELPDYKAIHSEWRA